MSDIKLFSIEKKSVNELQGSAVALEKSLQNLIEKNLETFLGVRFLGSEYSTGKSHGGRIDTLGIDENGCPVIIEYKRASNENVINQGLFYLDWLMDHKGEFELKVLKLLGKDVSENIEWLSPRLICIAGDYTKYDLHAVAQINRNVELMRYRKYGSELLLLELVNSVSADTNGTHTEVKKGKAQQGQYKTFTDQLVSAGEKVTDLYNQFKQVVMTLGDDVQIKRLKYYEAFKRIKNVACLELRLRDKCIVAYVKMDPKKVDLIKGFTADYSKIGHYGTGDLQVTMKSAEDIEKAMPILEKAYYSG